MRVIKRYAEVKSHLNKFSVAEITPKSSRLSLLIVIVVATFSCITCAKGLAEPLAGTTANGQTAASTLDTLSALGNNDAPNNSTYMAHSESVSVKSSTTGEVTPQKRLSESRGYLVTPGELIVIKQKADQGIEPYASAVDKVIDWAQKKWEFKVDKHEKCRSADDPTWNDFDEGIVILYAKALAYHLTGNQKYAAEVKEILQHIMTGVITISIDQQQCRLNFGWSTPEFVGAADLIEDYWDNTTCTGPISTLYDKATISSGNCKILFQNWLVKNPYYVISYSALDSQSNWGAAATNALAHIADYLWDRPNVLLVHRNPRQVKEGVNTVFTPAQAYAYANQIMIDRMNGYGVSYGSSSSCDYLSGPEQDPKWEPVKSQISEKGIIPEDSRREEVCNIPQYNGEYQNYPQIHLGNNIQQCELMLRRGDASCYDNIDNTDIPNYTFIDPDGVRRSTHLYPGRGSIERAIKAIIIDANTKWHHDSALELAYRYYYNYHSLPGFQEWFQQLDRPSGCGQHVCFGTLTHGFAVDEVPELPPTVSPP